jgi:4-hydroxy-tetrahydrodipicolinate reductase
MIMIKVAVAGCAGRMGRRILWALSESARAKLHVAFEIPLHGLIGHDSGLAAGLGENNVEIADSVNAALGCDVLIDFTVPASTEENLRFCRNHGINIVVATTGLSPAQKKLIAAASKKIAVVYSPNMGVGVNVLLSLVKKMAAALGDAYDIEIVEMHHNQKKDAPSGTALALGEAAAQGLKVALKDSAVYGRKGMVGARRKKEIGIHAVRGGDVIGEHAVIFAGPGEKIELSHSVITRDVFARGAVRAAEFISTRKRGLFTMQDVLGLPA